MTNTLAVRVEELFKRALVRPRIGLYTGGLLLVVDEDSYPLGGLLRVVRENNTDVLTDTAWRVLRAIEDNLPTQFAKTPDLAHSSGMRDSVERLEATTDVLRNRLVARTRVSSVWTGADLPLSKHLRLVGRINSLAYGYWPELDATGTEKPLLLYNTLELALKENRGEAVYEVTSLPDAAWRTVVDAQEVIAQKWAVVQQIAQQRGAYPYLAPIGLLN